MGTFSARKCLLIVQRSDHCDELSEILAREIENAEATIPLVDFDSRLGYEPSMEYTTDPYRIAFKIECTQKALDELSELLAAR